MSFLIPDKEDNSPLTRNLLIIMRVFLLFSGNLQINWKVCKTNHSQT